eukprot:c17094_g1_i1 orf=280-645(+)
MEQDTESKIQCASAAAASQFRNLLDNADIDDIKRLQLLILGRLQDSNAVLSHLNEFSERSFSAVANDFSRNTRLLKSMKADLDYSFRRIRNLKSRLASQYPSAFKVPAHGELTDCQIDCEK